MVAHLIGQGQRGQLAELVGWEGGKQQQAAEVQGMATKAIATTNQYVVVRTGAFKAINQRNIGRQYRGSNEDAEERGLAAVFSHPNQGNGKRGGKGRDCHHCSMVNTDMVQAMHETAKGRKEKIWEVQGYGHKCRVKGENYCHRTLHRLWYGGGARINGISLEDNKFLPRGRQKTRSVVSV